MNTSSPHFPLVDYLRARRRQRAGVFTIIALLLASVIATHAGLFGRCGDDWVQLDHRSFRVVAIDSGMSLRIDGPNDRIETVQLLGITALPPAAQRWLAEQVRDRRVTLLLQSPQTRDASGRLLAFVFLDDANLSVELTRAGLARADRTENSIMDGLIRPAESQARKKMLGIWSGHPRPGSG